VVSALVLFLAGCVAVPRVGHSPLTASEKAFISQVDPAASKVTKLSNQTIEVTNLTIPSGNPYEIFGSKRMGEVYATLLTHPKIFRVYETAAEKHCATKNQWPDQGIVSGENSKRFTCYEPRQWGFVTMQEKSNECERSVRGPHGDREFAQFITRRYHSYPQKHHPCQARTNQSFSHGPPNDFCEAYSSISGTARQSEQTCAEFVRIFKRVEANLDPAGTQRPGSKNKRSIESASKECTELGFTVKTEKHADCVLKLTR
jgi:hypothetical protein